MGARSSSRKAQAAWDRIEVIGGYGVWDNDMVVVSLAETGVTDDDLALLEDVPVQMLSLSGTAIGDEGLARLARILALQTLIVVDTRISEDAIERFRESRPDVDVTTQPPPKGTINPFTGEPL